MCTKGGGGSSPLIVAAIDFGTTYSGWAFSFKHEFEDNPTKIQAKTWTGGQLVSLKGPTCILLKKVGNEVKFEAFGYEAESQYATAVDNKDATDLYFYKRFKMMLFGKIGMDKNILLEDAAGKKLPALTVFSKSIWFLQDDLMKLSRSRIVGGGLTDKDVHWVITVPAIWNDVAKQFMREAAREAGIPDDRVTIALEPEAASLYCRHIPLSKSSEGQTTSLMTLRTGTKYIVLDAGGGTVDVTVHEVLPSGQLNELYKASGGAWGGTNVDEAYKQFLIKLVGAPIMKKFEKECLEDYIDMFRDFEIKKRTIDPTKNDKVTIRLPITLMEMFEEETSESLKDVIPQTAFAGKLSLAGGKLRIDGSIAKDLFKATTANIIKHLKDLTREPTVRGCNTILMVGGFSESKVLENAVRTAFPRMSVIVPPEAGLAVLKGAVMYGHNQSAIAGRKCKYTYGIATRSRFKEGIHPEDKKVINEDGEPWCEDVFSIHVRVGQTVRYGEAQEERLYTPSRDDQTEIGFPVYISPDTDPAFVTDEGCTQIGYLTVSLPDTTGGKSRETTVKMIFGGTEIVVECVEVATGKVTSRRINFLG